MNSDREVDNHSGRSAYPVAISRPSPLLEVSARLAVTWDLARLHASLSVCKSRSSRHPDLHAQARHQIH